MSKRIRSSLSVRSIPGASTNDMAHHVKGCLEDISPDTVILHNMKNDLKSRSTSQKNAIDIVNLALTIRSEKKTFSSEVTIRNDNLDKRRKEVTQFLERKFSVYKIKFHWQPDHKLDNVKSRWSLTKSTISDDGTQSAWTEIPLKKVLKRKR